MSGGPDRRHLPEHEHPDVQLSVRFGERTSTTLVAASEPHSGSWDEGERVVVVLLSPALLEEAVDDLVYRGYAGIRSQRCIQDELIEGLAGAILREFLSPHSLPNRRLYFESIGHTLAGHVVRTYTRTITRDVPDGVLSRRQLEDLSEFVDDALCRTIGIADLASRVGLPPRRFADSFRNTTGLTPYQYIIHRRVNYAKRLLGVRSVPIIEVALLAGFANQSHFTAVFTRLTRMTPGRWRAACT